MSDKVTNKNLLKVFILRKRVSARSLKEAIASERSEPVLDGWLDEQWLRESEEEKSSINGFNPNR